MFLPKHLYTIKQDCWLVFSTKELVPQREQVALVAGRDRASGWADYWSEECDCLVTFIEPESNFMVLEVEGKFVKVLGDRVGWIVADMSVDWVRESFEEITHV